MLDVWDYVTSDREDVYLCLRISSPKRICLAALCLLSTLTVVCLSSMPVWTIFYVAYIRASHAARPLTETSAPLIVHRFAVPLPVLWCGTVSIIPTPSFLSLPPLRHFFACAHFCMMLATELVALSYGV